MPVDRETFDLVRQRVIDSAPAGLSREQFDALLDQELGKVEAASRQPSSSDPVRQAVADVGTGIAKGVGNTVIGLGELMHHIPGVSAAVDALYGQEGLSARAFPEYRAAVQPTNTAQKIGFYG